MTECGQDVGVDLAGKDHLRHFQRGVVGYTTSFNDRLFDTELRGEFAELFATAVHDTDSNSHLVQQGQLFSQRNQILPVFSDLAGKFYDKRLFLKSLNVGQRLPQEI